MSDLPTLEAALFQRELDELTKKLHHAIQAVRDVFAEYADRAEGISLEKDKDLAEIQSWVSLLPTLGQGYYAGYYLTVSTPDLKRIPAPLERAIREAAIRKHLSGAPRVTLPAPMTEESEKGTIYFVPAVNRPELYCAETWEGDDFDLWWLKQRLCYRTAEDAITVAKAQLELLNPAKP